MGKPPTAYSPAPEAAIKIQNHRSERPHLPPLEPEKWFPWLVPTIVIINILIFATAMYFNNCPAHSGACIGTSYLGRFAFETAKQNPLLGPSAATLLEMGALEVKKVVEEHEIWRLITCMWLHAGIFHILANMLSLLFVGIRLEQEFGFARIGTLYVVSGIGGSLSSSLFVRDAISVGASGALFGLLGAMLSELLVNWTIYENKLESLASLVTIILLNMAVGILPHVDNFAHIGGFVTGFLLGFVLMIQPQYGYVNTKGMPYNYSTSKSKYKAYQLLMLILALILLTVGFTVGLTLLMKGVNGNDHCSWCHYLTCMPSPFWTCNAKCTSSQYENMMQLTCIHNNRTGSYTLTNSTTMANVQQLCAELCH